MPRSTFYSCMAKQVTQTREMLSRKLCAPGTIAIHWLDNYARTFARQGIYLDQETFVSMLWTVHGVKIWPNVSSLTMNYCYNGEDLIRAMPRLSLLLSDSVINTLSSKLGQISIGLYEVSLSEQRHVRRVPLKPNPLTVTEEKYMSQSLDGFQNFEPVDIYNVNIQAYAGLVKCIRKCQILEGFGTDSGPKHSEYSAMLLDVSTFWMTFRLLYSFTGLAPILCDLFLILGPWHTYMYAHVCAWSEFRSPFLASAYFHLFPSQNLFFRPRLLMSSTFFTWLRAAYPKFRPLLIHSLTSIKFLRTLYDIQYTISLKGKKLIPANKYKRIYIKLHNMFYFFEYVLPAIADYGSALKLNDWPAFKQSFLRLFKFFLCSKSQGMC